MLFPATFPVTCHTRFVGPGSLFVALKGERLDGVDFIAKALELGAQEIALERGRIAGFKPLCLCGVAAIACLQEKEWQCSKCGILYHFPVSARHFLAEEAAKRLGFPAQKLALVGVTGTKGKTTTTFLAEHVARAAGKKTALLGTIMARIGDEQCEAEMTTPTADQLHVFFAACVAAGVEVVFMEVSSHALALEKLHGLSFSVVGFTNFEQDHLDFHGTIDHYFSTKLKIFEYLAPGGTAVLCAETPRMHEVAAHASRKEIAVVTFAQKPHDATYRYEITRNSFEGVGFALEHSEKTTLNGAIPALFGRFNAANAITALLLNHALGVKFEGMAVSLKTFPGVPGRLQKHTLQQGAYGFVDYAHNAMAVDAVLKELRPLTDELIVIFGCGGNRDPLRRPTMGAAAAKYADTIIVTDDNPRFEESSAIIADILKGIPAEKQASVICEPARAKAIALAAARAKKGAVIALLGKGHEKYFLIKGEKLEFDDFKEISQY